MLIYSVNLKHTLGQIQSDHLNAHEALPSISESVADALWHRDATSAKGSHTMDQGDSGQRDHDARLHSPITYTKVKVSLKLPMWAAVKPI